LLHAVRIIPDYRPIFHAMTQVQGFLTCMAAGFLLTMVPRRTESAPASAATIVVCAIAPVATAVAAWFQWWNLSQAAWLAAALALAGFSLRRFHGSGSGRRPPAGFIWISFGLVMGIAGALISLVYGSLDPQYAWLHAVASDLVLQGLFLGFVLGAGSLALPLMTRDGAPPDLGATPGDRLALVGHMVAATALIVSFWLEATTSLRAGVLLRALVVIAVYLLGVQLWRLPERPGWNARGIWAAAWMVPLGYLLAGAFPLHAIAGLHVTFIGGFSLLAFFISAQVALGHGGYADLRLGKPWGVPALALPMLAAIGFRAAMEVDPQRFFVWMAAAAFSFLCAALIWVLFVVPKLLPRDG